ncbi:MAG: DUF4142 domain-containing protein [Pseudomonas sp.]
MHSSKPTHFKLLTAAVMSVALGYVAQPALAQDVSNDRAPQTSGPTGTPATTGDGGSADTTGAIRDGDRTDGGMAATDANRDSVDAEDFFEEASALGVAEIETGQKALEQSDNAEIRAFAERMIKDHAAANEKMAKLAADKGVDISDEAKLMDRARTMILQARDGESFDAAYANNQVSAHERTIELFERASRSDDTEVAAFARETLPKLKEHLEEARKLVQNTPDT